LSKTILSGIDVGTLSACAGPFELKSCFRAVASEATDLLHLTEHHVVNRMNDIWSAARSEVRTSSASIGKGCQAAAPTFDAIAYSVYRQPFTARNDMEVVARHLQSIGQQAKEMSGT
jgi:hypothetical protein